MSLFQIMDFSDKYDFLSNFYLIEIVYKGIKYPSLENAYQAAKTLNDTTKKLFTDITPAESKSLGRQLKIIDDWDNVKLSIMKELLEIKFTDKNLAKKLIKTKKHKLKEGNYWHDNFWGDCTCQGCKDIKGKNKLGKLLMEVREELA